MTKKQHLDRESVQRSWVKPHFHNLNSSGEVLDCLIAETNLEDAYVEMAKPYPALVERHILLVRDDAVCAKLDWTINGRRKTDAYVSGDLILNPAGLTTFPRWDKRVKLHLLAIRPESLKRAAEQMDMTSKVELIPHYGFRDRLLAQLIQTVVSEFSQPYPDLLYAETMAHATMAHLLKTSANNVKPTKDLKGKLSARTLQSVAEYMQANLSRRVSLEELAAIAQLSTVHFARLFRQTTGRPPHQWLLEQRLRQAEKLLIAKTLTISEIATQTGFSDQSHLTRAFRRSRGMTPSHFRSH
ncbi:helix-turn-helix domain-containing protein [Terriglobus tenax]|uniref:helix-turn-helix domain-containing protein n=1 Tax=Terriglobus tenax TaxID=1111115 RepID=UPI0021E0AFF9|nr:AraC family transcriptional regulator [Terriglobus tenax]